MPGPAIRHCDQKGTVEGLHLDIDFTGFGELDCIADEIKEHLAEPPFIPMARGRSWAGWWPSGTSFFSAARGLHSP